MLPCLITHADYVCCRGQDIQDRLFVSLQHNSKTNDPKVFELGIGNDLEIYLKWYAFGVKRSRSLGQ